MRRRVRNENGAYMKLMNFRRFDPQYTASGRHGLVRGAKAEEDVWREFSGDPHRRQEAALRAHSLGNRGYPGASSCARGQAIGWQCR
jgi:hypothetical protein